MGALDISDLFAAPDGETPYLIMQDRAAKVAEESDAQLIEACRKRVEHLARKYSTNFNTKDLVQEGLAALLVARRTWRQEAEFWTYAQRFVLGAMVRYVTNESWEPSRAGDGRDDSRLEKVECGTRTAEDLLEIAECAAALPESMLSLSETERKVVRLHLVDDLPFTRIARELNMSNDKAERIYHGAMSELRERVGAVL